MAGCYGNTAEDRYFERMLYKHLENEEKEDVITCAHCSEEYTHEDGDGSSRYFCADCLAELEPEENYTNKDGNASIQDYLNE